MEIPEDLAQALSFQLDLLRLAMAPLGRGGGNRETAPSAELERLIEAVPAAQH
jgi:hypothetical protein